MNDDTQQQQGGQGTVPMRDPNDPKQTVFMVPRAKMQGYIDQGVKVVPNDEFQKRYMIPSQKAAAARKPSAALGPTGQPINQPPPVAGAGAGAPPYQPPVSTGVPYGTTPGGASPAQQAGSGVAGILGRTALGAVKEPFYNVAQLAQLPAQVATGKSSVPSFITPTGDAEKFGAGLVDLAEYAIPAGAGEKLTLEWAQNTLTKIAPKAMQAIDKAAATKGILGIATRLGKIEAEQIAKATYQALVAGVAGAAQGRDPAKSASIGARWSLLLGHLALGSPSVLEGVFGVKKRLGGIDIRGSSGAAAKMLYERIPGFTKSTILRNAERELNRTETQLASMFATPLAGGVQIKAPLYTMMRDLQNMASKVDPQVSEAEAKKIQGLINEMERFSESVADRDFKKQSGDVGRIERQIRDISDKIQREPSPLIQKHMQDQIDHLTEKALNMEKNLLNQFNEISGPKLNKLRRVMEDEYLPVGKAKAYWSDSEKIAMQTYDKIVQSLAKGRPESTQLIRDTYTLRDILDIGQKKESTAFGAHTLMDPGQLSRMLPGYLGFEFGRRVANLPGGIAGTILGSTLGRPAIAATARGVGSPYTTGTFTGLTNLFLNPTRKDWSEKGKKTPYGNVD